MGGAVMCVLGARMIAPAKPPSAAKELIAAKPRGLESKASAPTVEKQSRGAAGAAPMAGSARAAAAGAGAVGAAAVGLVELRSVRALADGGHLAVIERQSVAGPQRCEVQTLWVGEPEGGSEVVRWMMC